MSEPERCPDGGTCHHLCAEACFRVLTCGPLSGSFPGNTWPEEMRAEHLQRHESTRLERVKAKLERLPDSDAVTVDKSDLRPLLEELEDARTTVADHLAEAQRARAAALTLRKQLDIARGRVTALEGTVATPTAELPPG